MTTTHQYIIELETDGDVDHDRIERRILGELRGLFHVPFDGGVNVKPNNVVYETSYPTPKPEDL